MKSDVCNVQLKQTRKVSYAEGALLGVVLVIATKFCTLPSVLAGLAKSKAVWAAAILTSVEFSTAFFSLKTARRGGLQALSLPNGVKVGFYLFFLLFFAFKLAAFTREISTYYALSLFENAPVLPIGILLLAACSLLSSKGYAAVGRMMEIFVWLFVFVFLFVVIFTRTEGNLFNALAIVNPDCSGLGKGVFGGLGWFGDTAVLSLLDLSGVQTASQKETNLPTPMERNKAKRRIAFAAALFCFLTIVIFYAVFTSVYGNAAKMTDYAFIKLSAFKANTDELGSADWPVIVLWSIVTTLYLTLILLSGKECLYGAIGKDGSTKNAVFPYLLLGGAALIFAAVFMDEEGDYQMVMTKAASVISLLAIAATIGLGVYSLVKTKGENNEKQN